MTDNEIIKAYECCCLYEQICPETCPMINDGQCISNLRKGVLDLINRQQAEIERLKKGWKADVIETENAKAEAVKEFEERAIKNICEKVYAPTPVQSCIVGRCKQVIIETAKEMVGDTE